MVRRFRRGKKTTFFSERTDCWHFKAYISVEKITQISKLWLRRVNIKSYLSSKVDPILKLIITRQLLKLQMFSAKKSKCHAVVCRQILIVCTRVQWVCQAVDELLFYFILGRKLYIAVDPNIPLQTKQIWREKEHTHTFGNGLARIHRTRAPTVYLHKTAWTLDA